VCVCVEREREREGERERERERERETHGKFNTRLSQRECVECLIGKQKKPILFKVTEPSSIPYRTHSACAKMAAYPDPSQSPYFAMLLRILAVLAVKSDEA